MDDRDVTLRHLRCEQVDVERPDVVLSVQYRPPAVDDGHESTVLLLHGLAGYGGEWAALVEHLPASFGVMALDQRGHGRSQAAATLDVSMHQWVDDVVSCIEKVHRTRAVPTGSTTTVPIAPAAAAVTIVGQSMGCIVAMLVASQRPDLVETLVLIEGGIAPVDDETIDGLQRWFASWPECFASKGEAQRFFGKDESSTPAWVTGLRRTEGGLEPRFEPETMLAAIAALGEDLGETWKRVTAPTVVMRATQSAISDHDIARMVAARPDVELVTMVGGHDLHLDEPELVANVVARCAAAKAVNT